MMLSKHKAYILGAIFLVLTGVMIYIYRNFNPIDYALFPKCPTKTMFGVDCAGCGSQRAIHHLLNGEFKLSFVQNILIIPSIPYIGLGLYFQTLKQASSKQLKWRKILFGERAIWIVGAVIVLYSLLRNLI